MAHPISEKRVTAWVFAAALVYFTALSSLAVLHHRGLRTSTNDLGNSVQAIWRASQGDLSMRASNSASEGFYSRLQMHLNLIYLLIAPLYRLWPDPKLLLLLTSAACALGGIGLFYWARSKLGDPLLAAIPAMAYWISPIVHEANLFDFKVLTLAACFIIWMVWAFDSGRTRLGWTFFALALICQEDIAPILMTYGAVRWIEGRRRQALICAVVPVAYLIVSYFVIVPFASGHGTYQGTPDARYAWLFQSKPEMIWRVASSPDHLRLPIYLLLSGAVAAFRGWRYLLLALPHLLGGVFSAYTSNTRVTGSYYWIVCEAAIILACVASCGGGRIRGVPKPLVYLAGSTLFFSLVLSPVPYNGFITMGSFRYAGEDKQLEEMIARVPAGAAVSAQNNLGAHLAHREIIAAYPNKASRADFLIFHLRFNGYDSGLTSKFPQLLFGMNAWTLAEEVKKLTRDPAWGLVARKDGFYLFQKGAPSAFSAEEIEKALNDDIHRLKLDTGRFNNKQEWMYYVNQPFDWKKLEEYVHRTFF